MNEAEEQIKEVTEVRLTNKEYKEVLEKICPDCKGKLRITATGGLTINLICLKCEHRFSNEWCFGGERL